MMTFQGEEGLFKPSMGKGLAKSSYNFYSGRKSLIYNLLNLRYMWEGSIENERHMGGGF